jgi:hypothetical protein
MFRIVPLGAFKHGFDLLDESGQPLAGFRGSVWREGGQIVAGPQRWEFGRDGRRRFRLDGPAGTVASAWKPSVWSSGWEVEAGTKPPRGGPPPAADPIWVTWSGRPPAAPPPLRRDDDC